MSSCNLWLVFSIFVSKISWQIMKKFPFHRHLEMHIRICSHTETPSGIYMYIHSLTHTHTHTHHIYKMWFSNWFRIFMIFTFSRCFLAVIVWMNSAYEFYFLIHLLPFFLCKKDYFYHYFFLHGISLHTLLSVSLFFVSSLSLSLSLIHSLTVFSSEVSTTKT